MEKEENWVVADRMGDEQSQRSDFLVKVEWGDQNQGKELLLSCWKGLERSQVEQWEKMSGAVDTYSPYLLYARVYQLKLFARQIVTKQRFRYYSSFFSFPTSVKYGFELEFDQFSPHISSLPRAI